MAFVRSKIMDGRRYYQLVRNYREAGRHRQEVLCHLGTNDTFEAAIAEVSREESHFRSGESEHRRNAEEMKINIPNMFEMKFGTVLPTLSEARKRERDTSERYRDWLGQTFSMERLDGLRICAEELRFLQEVELYHRELRCAEWYKEQADAQRARLEKLRRCQQTYG